MPTEAGRLVFSYAEEIFALGADLLSALAQRPTHRPMRFVAGIDDVVPTEIATDATDVSRRGFARILRDLESRQLDVVLAGSPVTPSLNMRAYNHHLGSCDMPWMAAPALAKTPRSGLPKSLDGARLLLPTSDTVIRRALDQWLDARKVHGEFYAISMERNIKHPAVLALC